MHTYNYISNIYAKNTFGMAEFLPIHVQNCMLKKEKNKFWACSTKQHYVSAKRHWVMPNSIVFFSTQCRPALWFLSWHLVGTIFLNIFFFLAKGVKAWNGMHVSKVIKIPIRILKSYDFTIQYYENDSNLNWILNVVES